MDAAGVCSQIIHCLILSPVGAAILLVQGSLLRRCPAGAKTFAEIDPKLRANSRIDEREFE